PPEPQLILADTMFNKLPWVHHGFEPAEQLKIRSWQTIQGSELAPYDTVYLLKQRDRLQLEVEYFKLYIPDFVKKGGDTTILSMDGLIIEAIDANHLRSLLSK
ncbi:MAG: hypothetical protein KDC44_03730, partial [Phaeodactylibacter sp.]|nr:hypothetical protein [Phaeodactylibacter sp.]